MLNYILLLGNFMVCELHISSVKLLFERKKEATLCRVKGSPLEDELP